MRVSCELLPNVREVLTGLNAGTALALANGDSTLTVTSNGAFAFPQTVADSSAYDLQIRPQRFGGTCTVAKG